MNEPIALLESLVNGHPTEAVATIDDACESLILLRDGDRVDGFLNICPHAGRRLDWAPGKFLLSREGHLVCAAHGASFALPSGECIAGPCRGASLRRIEVFVEGAAVIATGRAL